jgi:hypothetical protein
MMPEGRFPAFPPGFWRRIIVQPYAGGVIAALEDDVHRFHLRLEHDGKRIDRIDTWELRVPYRSATGTARLSGKSALGAIRELVDGNFAVA